MIMKPMTKMIYVVTFVALSFPSANSARAQTQNALPPPIPLPRPTHTITWPDPMPPRLVVIASQPMVVGDKTVVKLAMKNGLAEKIKSARAVIFLQDDQGKVIGQPITRWVIGGSEKAPGLPAGTTNSFNFVITGDKPLLATNPTVKISFSRIVLEGGKAGDVTRDVLIQDAK